MGKKGFPFSIVRNQKREDKKLDRIVVGCVVYNEEGRLPGFLKAHSFADIVIIDQSSTDKTASIAKKCKQVSYYKVTRFEKLGEASFNLLQKLTPKDSFLLLLGVDERITEEAFGKMRKRATLARERYNLHAFFVHRKNYIDGRLVNHLFRTDYDTEGKDWQMRLGWGPCIMYQPVPHTHPTPTKPWGYMGEDIFIEHPKTLQEELDSIMKRAGSVNAGAGRDVSYHAALVKEFGEAAKL